MTEKEGLHEELLQILQILVFPNRYYDLYRRFSGHKAQSGLQRADWEDVLAGTKLNFKFSAKEHFFQHEENVGQILVGLNIAFQHDQVEPILYVKRDRMIAGGPFPRLARQVALREDPKFKMVPASPKIPFSSRADLEGIIVTVIDIFRDICEKYSKARST